MLFLTLLSFHFVAISPILTESIYDVTKYGADNRGRSLMTEGVQKAIDTAASRGGGTIFFPSGQYISGPIRLRSNINVHFANNVVITWSNDEEKYPPLRMQTATGLWPLKNTPLIYAFGEKNITIRGRGKLEGQGSHWWQKNNSASDRPNFMVFFEVNQLLLEDFTVQNSPCMNVNPIRCRHVTIKGITIYNPYHSHNTDGINSYSNKDVLITGVTISTGDDCIALDAGTQFPSHNLVITNSHMKWGHSGVGMGSAILGGLSNITVTNCIFEGTDRGLYIKSMRGRGAVIENVHYSNITMNNILKEGIALSMLYNPSHQDAALHDRNIQREPFRQDTPVYRNLHYDGVRGNSKLNPIFFVGLPESHIANIEMKNIAVKSSLPIFLNNTQNVVINGKHYS